MNAGKLGSDAATLLKFFKDKEAVIYNEDGTVKVINKGYDYVDGKWKESTGKAKFQGPTTVGALKVSFFGPFYSGYNVIAVDDLIAQILFEKDNSLRKILKTHPAIIRGGEE